MRRYRCAAVGRCGSCCWGSARRRGRPPILPPRRRRRRPRRWQGSPSSRWSFALGIDVASPLDLFVIRIGIEPGTVLPNDANDPTWGSSS